MWSPVRHFTSAGFPEACETPPAAVVRMIRRRTQPEIPIEPGRRIGVRRRSLPSLLSREAAVKPCLGIGDLADLASANHLHHFLEMLAGALLSPTGDDPVVLGHRFDHLAAFVNGVRGRLLDINVLPGRT